MKHVLKAEIEIEVIMEVEADSPDLAAQIFKRRICVGAYLSDLKRNDFPTLSEMISSVSILEGDKE